MPLFIPGIGSSSLAKIKTSIMEAMDLLDVVLLSSSAQWFDHILPKYFPSTSGNTVKEVLTNVVGASSAERGTRSLSTVYMTTGDKHSTSCSEASVLATHQNLVYEPGNSLITICPSALRQKTMAQQKCSDLETRMTSGMDSLAATILHELL